MWANGASWVLGDRLGARSTYTRNGTPELHERPRRCRRAADEATMAKLFRGARAPVDDGAAPTRTTAADIPASLPVSYNI